MRDLAALPKAHLHLHLEGAMRPGTLVDLADQAGIPVPEVRGYGSFAAFAAMYVAACDVLRSEDDLRRLVAEVVEDAALAGAVWVEPAVYLPHHNDRLGPDEAVLEVVLDEAAAASERHGIDAGVLIAADRTVDPAIAVTQARIAVRYADEGVVAFGLHNDEVGFPPEPFADAFAVARNGGLLSAPHGGELEGAAWVAGALDALRADRIQHGIRSLEDPTLVQRLADAGVCLDVCPTSNVMLGVVPSVAEHPLPRLIQAGVACSLNADDPLLFGPGLLEEYELVRTELGLADEQLAGIARSSVLASGADDSTKALSVKAIDTWLAAA